MRGDARFWILIALALVAATELNTTTYTAGDTFTLDEHTYEVRATLEGNASIATDGQGEIYAVDECAHTTYHEWCLTASNNESADITFYQREYNLTLTRTQPTSTEIGETYEVELRVENNAEKTLAITVHERTNASIAKTGDFTEDLAWTGTLSPGQGRTLEYTASAPKAGTYTHNATARGGEYNASSDETVTATDYLTITADYTENATPNKQYTFTLTLSTDLEEPVETDVEIDAPTHLRITDTANLTDELQSGADLNGTRTYALTYEAISDGSEHTTATITTTRNGSDATRTYEYPLRRARFTHPAIIHDHDEKAVPADQDTELPIQLHNPNTYALTTQLAVTSVLVQDTETLTLNADQTVTRTYTVRPNRTDSEYLLRINLTYQDPNDETYTQIDTIRLHTPTHNTTTKQTNNETRTPPTIRLDAPSTAAHNQTYTLTLTAANVNGTAHLTITKDEKTLTNTTTRLTNQTLTIQTSGPGRYHATLTHDGQTASDTKTVSEPETPTTPPAEQDGEPGWAWLLAGAALVILAVGGWYYSSDIRRERRITALEDEIRRTQHTLQAAQAFHDTFIPPSPEDAQKKRALGRVLQQEQNDLSQKARKLARLRKQNN